MGKHGGQSHEVLIIDVGGIHVKGLWCRLTICAPGKQRDCFKKLPPGTHLGNDAVRIPGYVSGTKRYGGSTHERFVHYANKETNSKKIGSQ